MCQYPWPFAITAYRNFWLRPDHPSKLSSPDFYYQSAARADSIFRKDKIQWECQNGGQFWTDSAAAGYGGNTSLPDGFCGAGFSSLNAAFIIGLLVDLVFQVKFSVPAMVTCSLNLPFLLFHRPSCSICGPYADAASGIFFRGMFLQQLYMFFMMWRFQKRLEHYQNMKGPFYGGGSDSFWSSSEGLGTCGRAHLVSLCIRCRYFCYPHLSNLQPEMRWGKKKTSCRTKYMRKFVTRIANLNLTLMVPLISSSQDTTMPSRDISTSSAGSDSLEILFFRTILLFPFSFNVVPQPPALPTLFFLSLLLCRSLVASISYCCVPASDIPSRVAY